jgi:hypothetical protein
MTSSRGSQVSTEHGNIEQADSDCKIHLRRREAERREATHNKNAGDDEDSSDQSSSDITSSTSWTRRLYTGRSALEALFRPDHRSGKVDILRWDGTKHLKGVCTAEFWTRLSMQAQLLSSRRFEPPEQSTSLFWFPRIP